MQNKERFIPYELFGDTPATRRWFVISIYQATLRELENRGIEEPSPKEVENYIHRAKETTFPWKRIQDIAEKIRRNEFGDHITMVGKKNLNEGFASAIDEIQAKYLEINGNPEENRSYLDELVFSG